MGNLLKGILVGNFGRSVKVTTEKKNDARIGGKISEGYLGIVFREENQSDPSG